MFRTYFTLYVFKVSFIDPVCLVAHYMFSMAIWVLRHNYILFLYYFGLLFVLLVLRCLFKDTRIGSFLGWPTALAGSSRTTHTLQIFPVHFFKVGFNTGAIPVLLGMVQAP